MSSKGYSDQPYIEYLEKFKTTSIKDLSEVLGRSVSFVNLPVLDLEHDNISPCVLDVFLFIEVSAYVNLPWSH